MSHKRVLSITFNMSLGLIPAIISILLCKFLTQDLSIYIGTSISLLYSYFILYRSKPRIHNFILYISTIVLLFLSIATLSPIGYCPEGNLPITLEASIVLPMLILYLHKKRFINFVLKKRTACDKRNVVQSAESTIVSARIILIFVAIHFILTTIYLIIGHNTLNAKNNLWLFQLMPAFVFIFSIIFNQIGINYFNKIMKYAEHVPIVNEKGDVIGKSLKLEAISYKNTYINPVIRIAVISKGMLFLCNRSQDCILDKGKVDIPLECYLRYEETLEEGVERLMNHAFPENTNLITSFSSMHHFENKTTNRLIYLFIVNIKDESILCNNNRFKGGKLWTIQQIFQNIGENYFCTCLEVEYEHLKEIIYTTEKYKES
ncbi:hypothetical protein [uncultured Bacteroides sp.]|uniref:hypothetical protein n=1 Tax=uncultured Bacteroides sp. TaxID=162156 RepID=UPI002AAB939E|nr:hypothetical protein [uncultured Bacteroides sp.]